MITEIVAGATTAAALLLGAMVATINRSDQPHTDLQLEDLPLLDAGERDAVDARFDAVRAVLFTDDDNTAALTVTSTSGRHHHDTVEFVQLDYLLPKAYAALYAPRMLHPVPAASTFGPDDLNIVDDLDGPETDADRAFQPRPDCCEDCDEALDFAGITTQLVAEGASR